jgi:hypothetical protein
VAEKAIFHDGFGITHAIGSKQINSCTSVEALTFGPQFGILVNYAINVPTSGEKPKLRAQVGIIECHVDPKKLDKQRCCIWCGIIYRISLPETRIKVG